MSPRKRVHGSDAEKQAAFAKRQQERGRRRLCLWVEEGRAEALKGLAEREGRSMAELLEEWIDSVTTAGG